MGFIQYHSSKDEYTYINNVGLGVATITITVHQETDNGQTKEHYADWKAKVQFCRKPDAIATEYGRMTFTGQYQATPNDTSIYIMLKHVQKHINAELRHVLSLAEQSVDMVERDVNTYEM